MPACPDCEQIPLHVMAYCAVPEWWLTHQGPLLGTSVFRHCCTQAGMYSPHRTLCKSLAASFGVCSVSRKPGNIAQLDVPGLLWLSKSAPIGRAVPGHRVLLCSPSQRYSHPKQPGLVGAFCRGVVLRVSTTECCFPTAIHGIRNISPLHPL